MLNQRKAGIRWRPTFRLWTFFTKMVKMSEGQYHRGAQIGLEILVGSGEFWREVEFVDGIEQSEAPLVCESMEGDWSFDGDKRVRGRRSVSLEPSKTLESNVWDFGRGITVLATPKDGSSSKGNFMVNGSAL